MSHTRDPLVSKAMEVVEHTQQRVERDPYRLRYHLMPPVGLLNDPMVLSITKAQWNPIAARHGAKFWGHVSSADLVHWQAEPIALAPNKNYDKDGCYSGSAIQHQGKMFLFYTGNVKDEAGNRSTYQCLAVSSDGIHFDKKGPIITLPEGFTAHFRDPKVGKLEIIAGIW